MKIFYWTDLFYPYIGGVEILSLKLIPALQKQGYEFHVITSHGNLNLPDEEVYQGIFIHRFHFLTSFNNRNLKQIIATRKQVAQLKEKIKPDLVHLHFSSVSAYFHCKTITACNATTLLTVHKTPNDITGHHLLLEETLDIADWVIAISAQVLRDLRQIRPKKIELYSSLVYNGLEMPKLKVKSPSFTEPVLLCVGRVIHWKGFDVAIKAVASLINRFPSLQLIIAGDGVVKAELEQLVKDLNLENTVKFLGWVEPEEIPLLINSASMAIIPSRCWDSLPVVAQQASQLARPIIASNVGGLPEIIIHEETGLIVEPENVSDLVSAISFYLENPQLAIKMGKNARNRVQEVFGWETFIKNYEILYEQIIHQKKSVN